MFDDVILLAKGGRTAYYGPVADVRSYFEGLGYSVPAHMNPPDFYMVGCAGAWGCVGAGLVGWLPGTLFSQGLGHQPGRRAPARPGRAPTPAAGLAVAPAIACAVQRCAHD
jgi:hypothetical protein